MFKRDTRVQIVIVENGKYILLKHHARKENLYFWGLPGGGAEEGETVEEAAIREAWEETGLKIKLLPFVFENKLDNNIIYKRTVTFLAVPIEGIAATGYEPEAEYMDCYELVDIKWKDFYDSEGLDHLTEAEVAPFRSLVDSNEFIKRAGAVIYKIDKTNIYYLLVSAFRDKDFFILPQGHVDSGESFEAAAVREAAEEAGILCDIKESLGFYLHEQKGKVYKTEIFSAEYSHEIKAEENRKIIWVALEDALKLELLRETRLLLIKCDKMLRNEL